MDFDDGNNIQIPVHLNYFDFKLNQWHDVKSKLI